MINLNQEGEGKKGMKKLNFERSSASFFFNNNQPTNQPTNQPIYLKSNKFNSLKQEKMKTRIDIKPIMSYLEWEQKYQIDMTNSINSIPYFITHPNEIKTNNIIHNNLHQLRL